MPIFDIFDIVDNLKVLLIIKVFNEYLLPVIGAIVQLGHWECPQVVNLFSIQKFFMSFFCLQKILDST